jgi:hypothetical protein
MEVLTNELRLRNPGSTFSQFAEADAATSLGRFNAISSPQVVGAQAAPKYEGAPNWAHDPTGIEPPLNFDVNALEPTGEIAEVKASLEPLGPSTFPAQEETRSASEPTGVSCPSAPLAGAEHGDPTLDRAPRGVGSPTFSSRRTYRRR